MGKCRLILPLFLLVISFGNYGSFAQSSSDYLKIAQDFHLRNELDSAMIFYMKAIESVSGENLTNGRLYLAVDIADVFFTNQQYAPGLELLNQTLPESLEYGDEEERLALLEAQLFKAYGWERTGDFIEARKAYEAARIYLIAGPEQEDFYIARYLYQPLGNIYTRLGEIEEALNLLERFKTISLREHQFPAAAEAINDIGIAYKSLNYYDEVIEDYEQALKFPDLPHLAVGLLYSNLATAKYETGQFQEALKNAFLAKEHFGKALRVGDQKNQVIAYQSQLQSTLGKIYAVLEKPALAISNFNQAIDLAYLAYGTFQRREIAKIHVNIGYLQLLNENGQLALEAFHAALVNLIPGLNPDDVFQNPDAGKLFAENTLFEALDGKSRAYEMLYDENGEYRYLIHLLDAFEAIHQVEFALRQDQIHDSSKLLLADESHQRNERAIKAAYQCYKITGDSKFAERAFQITENTKATILHEHIKNLKLKDLANIPDSIREDQLRLQYEIAGLRTQMINKQSTLSTAEDSLQWKSMESNLNQLLNQSRRLGDYMQEHYPLYHLAGWQNELLLDIKTVKARLLTEEGQLIAYFLGENEVYIFSLTHDNFEMKRVDHNGLISALVNDLRQSLSTPGTSSSSLESFIISSQRLYELLLQPVANNNTSHLTIIPDGILGYIPFDVLIPPIDEGQKYSDLPYLLKNKILSYGFSVNTLIENMKPQAKKANKSLLGVAPVFESQTDLAFLPFSEREVNNIQELFGGEMLLHADATKERFIQIADQFRILHLSSHAAVIDSLALQSWIGFSSGENQDSKLYLRELYALELNAELAVLSACETGSGRLSRGEGIMSLARGFATAGCQSLVTTLWPVNDISTSYIMTRFYHHLASGIRKDHALQLAKLDYLDKDNIDELGSHPFFWAAYIPLGNMNPIENEQQGKWLFWIIGIGVFMLFGGGLFYYQRKLLKRDV